MLVSAATALAGSPAPVWPDPAVFAGVDPAAAFGSFGPPVPLPKLSEWQPVEPAFVNGLIDAIKEAHLEIEAEINIKGVQAQCCCWCAQCCCWCSCSVEWQQTVRVAADSESDSSVGGSVSDSRQSES